MLRLMELLAYRTACLLNVSNLSKELGMERATVAKYLGILERLFLIQQLPAWHRNNAKRLIRAPSCTWSIPALPRHWGAWVRSSGSPRQSASVPCWKAM